MTLALLAFAALIAPDTGLRYAVGYEVVSPWPAPCADAGTCWLRWDRAERVEWYEVDDGAQTCAIVRGYVSERRGPREPRPVLWPAPGRCAPASGSAWLRVRACNAYGCGAWSESVEFQAVQWKCYDAHGAVPCGGGETP